MVEYDLRLKRITCREIINRHLVSANIKVEQEDTAIGHVIKAVLTLATIEEPVAKAPATWQDHARDALYSRLQRSRFSWVRSLGLWLWVHCPVHWREIIAVHKFPELAVPEGIGREFVHLAIREALGPEP